MTFSQRPYSIDTMLMIRLQRVGRKNDPAFRLVLTEKRSKPKSGELEILGSYHPKTKATILKNERILYWLAKGAKLSPTAHNLLISKGVRQGKKIGVVKTSLLKPVLPPVAAILGEKTAEVSQVDDLVVEEKPIEIIENKEEAVETKEETVA